MPPKKDDKCPACGGYEFSLIDGFMYCKACGSLLENFEELVQEVETYNQNVGKAKIRVKNKTDKNITEERIDGKPVQGKKIGNTAVPRTVDAISESLQKKSDFFAQQAIVKDPNQTTEEMPDYLYIVGLRLSTFSKMLAKCAFILTYDMHFPPTYSKTVLAVFQKYLGHCEIAFCSTELTNAVEDQFVAILENRGFAAEERARKRKKLVRLKSEGKKRLNQSTAAWQLLTQGDLTENLEMEDDLEETDESGGEGEESDAEGDKTKDVTKGFVRRISTLLSKEAVRKAAQIRFNLEYLVAILFTSALSSGCRNVFLSDFVRWIREDRFHISYLEVTNSLRGGDEKLNKSLQQGEHNSFLDVAEMELKFPLYEIQRTLTLFSQSLELGKNTANVIFAKVAARQIDNLNLPIEFLRRVLLIESMIPCDVLVDSRKQVDCRNGYDLGELTAMLPRMVYNNYMYCFGKKQYRTYTHEEIVFSVETKVLAYILLAIKMTIDIEKQKVEGLDLESQTFDIDTWMHQLEMRILCWEGHDMSMVFKPSCPIPDMTTNMPFANNAQGRYTHHNKLFLFRNRRPTGFRKCIPSKMSFHSTQNLPTVFKSRAKNLEEPLKSMPDSILAPLKFQAKILKKEMSMDKMLFENCDEDSVKTFFKSFSNCTLGDITEKTLEFADIFPACSKYTRYTRPDWTSRCTSKKDDKRMKEGDYRVYLSYKTCEDLMDCASDSFSERFRFLLDSFALIIGEDSRSLYAAFVMLEMHFLDAEKVENIRQSLLKHEPFILKCSTFRSDGNTLRDEIGVLSSCFLSRIDEIQFFTFIMPFLKSRDEESRDSASEEELTDDDRMMSDDDSDSEVENGHERLSFYRKQLKNAREEYKCRAVLNVAEKRRMKSKVTIRSRADLNSYEFETLFAMLAVKYW